MIDWFVGYTLRKRLVVAMICVFVAIYGYYSWTQLAIEAYPDIADTSSQVVTQAPGLAAEEIEQRITIPLERELNGTPGLLFMRSKSTFGLSLITLVFRDGIENYWSRQRINERIQNVTLPPGITAGLDPVTSPTGQIYYYTVESDTKGQRELSEIQRWIVIPALKQVPGVADVSNFGGIPRSSSWSSIRSNSCASICRSPTSRPPSMPTAAAPGAAWWRAAISASSSARSAWFKRLRIWAPSWSRSATARRSSCAISAGSSSQTWSDTASSARATGTTSSKALSCC